jgi:hypothetical protein
MNANGQNTEPLMNQQDEYICDLDQSKLEHTLYYCILQII